MKPNFKAIAGAHFLVDTEEISIDKMILILEELHVEHPDDTIQILYSCDVFSDEDIECFPVSIIHETVDSLLEKINLLAKDLEEMYNLGSESPVLVKVPKSLSEFRDSLRIMPRSHWESQTKALFTSESPDFLWAYVYDPWNWIEYNPKSQMFHMLLGRSDYMLHDLDRAEEILWDEHVKHETDGITDDHIFDDLQQRAKDLLNEIGEKCSLDEVDLRKHRRTRHRIEYLLKQF